MIDTRTRRLILDLRENFAKGSGLPNDLRDLTLRQLQTESDSISAQLSDVMEQREAAKSLHARTVKALQKAVDTVDGFRHNAEASRRSGAFHEGRAELYEGILARRAIEPGWSLWRIRSLLDGPDSRVRELLAQARKAVEAFSADARDAEIDADLFAITEVSALRKTVDDYRVQKLRALADADGLAQRLDTLQSGIAARAKAIWAGLDGLPAETAAVFGGAVVKRPRREELQRQLVELVDEVTNLQAQGVDVTTEGIDIDHGLTLGMDRGVISERTALGKELADFRQVLQASKSATFEQSGLSAS